MQYLLLKKTKNGWKTDCILHANRGGQQRAMNSFARMKKELKGEYWIMPVAHGAFYELSKGKATKLRRFYQSKK